MARVFITGSSDGLGRMAARVLIEQGHEVVVHGRNNGRTRDALEAAAGAPPGTCRPSPGREPLPTRSISSVALMP